MLTPELYSEAERRALLEMGSNRTLEAAQPVTFGKVGYPVTVSSIAELGRYAEVMHEGRLSSLYEWLGGFTDKELGLIETIAERVADLTQSRYGRRRIPRTSLVDALHMLRHVHYAADTLSPTVLEIGPGSGYVGALLVQLGSRYASIDIAQAFYLYQSHLLERTEGFCEAATAPVDLSAAILHLPWWTFYSPDGPPAVEADIVVCNHALCEMHPHARNYVLHAGASILKKRGAGAFLFSTGGNEGFHPLKDIIHSAELWGLTIAFRDHQMTALVHRDNKNLAEVANRITEGRQKMGTQAGGTLQAADQILARVLGTVNLATDDERFLDYVRPPT